MNSLGRKMETKNLIIIGEMAKICGVTKKTLRYYDKINLLKPVFIDPESGYRYYTNEQVYHMVIIKTFKLRKYSLKEIRKLFNNWNINSLMDFYANKLDEIEEEIYYLEMRKNIMKKRIKLFENINELNTKKILTQPQTKITSFLKTPIIYLTQQGSFTTEKMHQCLSELHLISKKEKISFNPPTLILYNKSGHFDEYDLAFQVIPQTNLKNKPFYKYIPAGNYASITYKGALNNFKNCYQQLCEWIKNNHYTIEAPVIFSNLYFCPDASENISEIKIKVKK